MYVTKHGFVNQISALLGIEGGQYYSRGSTVTRDFWAAVARCLGIKVTAKMTKQQIAAAVFDKLGSGVGYGVYSTGSTITRKGLAWLHALLRTHRS